MGMRDGNEGKVGWVCEVEDREGCLRMGRGEERRGEGWCLNVRSGAWDKGKVRRERVGVGVRWWIMRQRR